MGEVIDLESYRRRATRRKARREGAARKESPTRGSGDSRGPVHGGDATDRDPEKTPKK